MNQPLSGETVTSELFRVPRQCHIQCIVATLQKVPTFNGPIGLFGTRRFQPHTARAGADIIASVATAAMLESNLVLVMEHKPLSKPAVSSIARN